MTSNRNSAPNMPPALPATLEELMQQKAALLQEIQAELFFSIEERNQEADLTEKGRVLISGDDPNAFVLPDLLETMHSIDVDPKLSDQEKMKKKQNNRQ